MTDRNINSIDDLLKIIEQLEGTHPKDFWFRGVANYDWRLIPSIQRNQKRMHRERYISNDFYIRAKPIMRNPPEKKDYAGWVSLMQHFGLPTRLLDWSRSPLVAAFFAVEKYRQYPNTDACLWILKPRLLNEEGFGNYVYPVDAETSQKMLLPAFKERGYEEELTDKILACFSTDNNPRMYAQQSCFTIHNSTKRLEDICLGKMLYKIKIPSAARENLYQSLDIFGISESYVYPDLDHISSDIKRIYDINSDDPD